MKRLTAVLLTTLLTGSGLALATPADAAGRVMPGSFTGYAFDACQAPSQERMEVWRERSPYRGVAIYSSGVSRYCDQQTHLDAGWVSEQTDQGWFLLPLHVGPQASCSGYQHRISSRPSKAREQGRGQARQAVDAVRALGIARRSTLWYDLEHFDVSRPTCRKSALSMLSAWTRKLHDLGYHSGVYSNASSGIKMLDDARRSSRDSYAMPDRIWFARWDGNETTRSTYFGDGGWRRNRVHQYRGGHDERYGGLKINIDSNWVDVGGGSKPGKTAPHCGVHLDYATYPSLERGDQDARLEVARCLLRQLGHFDGEIGDVFTERTAAAVASFQASLGLAESRRLGRGTWTALLSVGKAPLLKVGSASDAVRRLQRSLNAAGSARLTVSGVFDKPTRAAVRDYQSAQDLGRTGVVTDTLWTHLQRGDR